MAKLTTKARKALPKSAFLGPDRTFPGNDKSHLRDAISGATRSERAGNISKGEETKIKSRARGLLGGIKK